jgi:hypothetical protein
MQDSLIVGINDVCEVLIFFVFRHVRLFHTR